MGTDARARVLRDYAWSASYARLDELLDRDGAVPRSARPRRSAVSNARWRRVDSAMNTETVAMQGLEKPSPSATSVVGRLADCPPVGRPGDRGDSRPLLADGRIDRRDLGTLGNVCARLSDRPDFGCADLDEAKGGRAPRASTGLPGFGAARRARARVARRRRRPGAGRPAVCDGGDDSCRRDCRSRPQRRAGARVSPRVPAARRADRRSADTAAHELDRRFHRCRAETVRHPGVPRGNLLHHTLRQLVGRRRLQRTAVSDRVRYRGRTLRLCHLPETLEEGAVRRRSPWSCRSSPTDCAPT